MSIVLLIATASWLAYSNGANDNFKGVATLYGSGIINYRMALIWASITAFLGCLVSIILAEHLLKTFSGAGLVPDQFLGTGSMLITVGGAAAATIFLSTVYEYRRQLHMLWLEAFLESLGFPHH